MSDSTENTSGKPHTLVVVLLVLNLVVAVAALAHVVYYIPQQSGAITGATTPSELTRRLTIDGVGDIGMGADGIAMALIEQNGSDPESPPKVLQTVSMSLDAFLKTVGQMNLMRERLEEKELIRVVE